MYLGPAGKPLHRAECRCEQCCSWMVAEIERLRKQESTGDAMDELDELARKLSGWTHRRHYYQSLYSEPGEYKKLPDPSPSSKIEDAFTLMQFLPKGTAWTVACNGKEYRCYIDTDARRYWSAVSISPELAMTQAFCDFMQERAR